MKMKCSSVVCSDLHVKQQTQEAGRSNYVLSNNNNIFHMTHTVLSLLTYIYVLEHDVPKPNLPELNQYYLANSILHIDINFSF